MIRALTAFAALAFATACTEPVAQRIGPYPVLSNPQFQIVGDVALNSRTQGALRAFENEQEAFGAMYVSQDGAGWYWRSESFTFDHVDREAKIICEADTGQPCQRYAVLMPANAPERSGIPVRNVPGIQSAIDRTNTGMFGAVAVMPTGAVGYSYNFETPKDAAARATEECEGRVASERGNVPRAARNALARSGGFDCAIYFEFGG
jgi:hypothetical protein